MGKYYGKKSGNKKGMMSGGKGFANLPQEKVMKEYPKGSYGAAEGYYDTREGIDMYAKSNHKQMMKR